MYSYKQQNELILKHGKKTNISVFFSSKKTKLTKFEFVYLDKVETNNRIPGFLDFIMKPNGNLKKIMSNVKKYEQRECC